jgi:type II secretory pathway pseudopilin PulG
MRFFSVIGAVVESRNEPNLSKRGVAGVPSGRRAAYTITEVLFAVALVGFVLTGVFTGISYAFAVLQTARENLRATQLLEEKMETIRLYSWEQINTPDFFPAAFEASANALDEKGCALYRGTIAITDAPLTESYAANLRQVVIEIMWNSGGVQRHRKMTTYVSRYGLQNYVY